ncbi:pentapeptide repeat-containing protein [Rhodococcus koreensis]|uniref:pentapeptide repeat-containing protein n=1 Tax=Rhodococcus koreensis TaxID=99653 RepID=UPI0036DA2A5B
MSTAKTKSGSVQRTRAPVILRRIKYFVVTSIVMFVGWWIVAEFATDDGVNVWWNWSCWGWTGFVALLVVPASLTAGFAPWLSKNWTTRIKPDGKNVSLKALIVGGIIVTFILAGLHYYWQAEMLTAEGESVWSLDSREVLDVSRSVAFSLGALGAIAALLVGYRRQKSTEESHKQTVKTDRENLKVEHDKRKAEDLAGLHDRYAKAVEQLANSNPTIRLGGVLVLGALANDWLAKGDYRQRQVCVDLLCAYLRSEPDVPAEVEENNHDQYRLALLKKDQDVRKAALESLSETRSLDYSKGSAKRAPWLAPQLLELYRTLQKDDPIPAAQVDLRGITLRGLNLRRARLAHLYLISSDLSGADLSQADLTSTNLTNATMNEVVLHRAAMVRTNLNYATLDGVDLSGAVLFKTPMVGTKVAALSPPKQSRGLSRAVLIGVKIRNASRFSASGINVVMDEETFGPSRNYLSADKPGTKPEIRDLLSSRQDRASVSQLLQTNKLAFPIERLMILNRLRIEKNRAVDIDEPDATRVSELAP